MTAPAATVPAAAPAAPAAPSFRLRRRAAYVGASLMCALTQGLAQSFLSTNIAQIAGGIGATTAQTYWLMVAFVVPRVAMPLMLVKVRMQFGLRRFAEVAIVIYLVMALAALAISDLRSAVVMQFLAGMAAAPLTTLAFMYMFETLPQQWQLRFGLPVVMAAIAVATPLARVISPALMADSGWGALHLMTLGMAAVSLALVYFLPLTSPPRVKAIALMDIVSWLLICAGFGGLVTAFYMGATYWWTDTPWLGWSLVVAIAALTLVAAIELNRKTPLLDIRWLTSPPVVHLTVTLLLYRLILSEQSSGAPRMFQVLGVTQDQLVPLFALLAAATVAGALALIPFMAPKNVPRLHVAALSLIAIGAFVDSHATIDTRPAQMMLSQALIAFGGSLFLAPAMMQGLLSALARGPNYILSFIVIFVSTQTLGGVIGSGLFSTFINHRQAVHLQVLREQLTAIDPLAMQQIAQRGLALAPQIADAAQRRAQALAQIAQDASAQAYVLAYNDAYLLTSIVALTTLGALLLHMLRDRLAAQLQPLAGPTP